MANLYIGLMSGTSIDGIDAVLVDFQNSQSKIIASHSIDFDKETKALLHSLCSPSDGEIDKAGISKNRLVEHEARVVNELLAKENISPSDVIAIGSHGQTLRHRPELGFTLQLDDGALLAAKTNIDVICDFRSADIAHGGNGAPLAQAFHRMQFRCDEVSLVLNLGGISNLTVIDKDDNHTILEAFDCGPANTLIDAACRLLLNLPYDKDGLIAKSGLVVPDVLAKFLQAPYLQLPPPKSTGREDFSLDFIKDELLVATQNNDFIPDLIATLTEFTVVANVNAIRHCIYKHKIESARLILCGGGAYNPIFKERFEKALSRNHVSVVIADELGVDAKLLEAHTFAYFAYKFTKRECIDLCDSTGAKKPSILGCLYPATK